MWLLLACTPDDGRHPIHPGERPPLDSGDADTDADSGTDSPSWFAAYWANDVNAVATPSQTAAELGFAPWGNAGPSGDLRNANAIVAGMSDAGWQLPSDAPYSGSGSTTHGSTDQFLAAVDFRLEEAIRRFSAARVLILGDLVHGRVAPSVVDDVAAWRAGVSVAMTLVRGNHDRHTPELPEEWRI